MENGIIRFSDDFVVDSSLTPAGLNRIKRKYSIEPVISNGMYKSFRTEPVSLDGKKVIPTIYFENDVISQVSIYLTSVGNGWGASTRAEQEQKKIDQDAWLLRKLNKQPPYEYSWGKIESVYDPRSGASGIVLTYRK